MCLTRQAAYQLHLKRPRLKCHAARAEGLSAPAPAQRREHEQPPRHSLVTHFNRKSLVTHFNGKALAVRRRFDSSSVSAVFSSSVSAVFALALWLALFAASAQAARTSPELGRGTETVLLVEDEEGVRELTREILEENGYKVVSTRDGREALRLSQASDEPIQLLLTDVVMPHMGGRELADRLAPAQPQMRVLFMSGYTDDAIPHHGVLDRGTALIEKPFTTKALTNKIRETLMAGALMKG